MEQFWHMCRGFVKRWGIIEFFVEEKESVTDICQLSWNVYIVNAVDKISVCCRASQIAGSEKGQAEFSDTQCSGWPTTAVTLSLLNMLMELIWNYHLIIIRKFCNFKPSVPKGSVNNVVVALGYSKVCAHWFPWSLNDCHKTALKRVCPDFVFPHGADCEGFLSWIVTGNETCNHHF